MSRLFRIATICSSVLCLLVLPVWIHSYWRIHQISWLPRRGSNVAITFVDAGLGVVAASRYWCGADFAQKYRLKSGYLSFPAPVNPANRWMAIDSCADEARGKSTILDLRFAGIDLVVGRDDPGLTWLVALPCWLLACLSAIFPSIAIWRHRKARRRARQGLCPRCGYDLRATPERCPECGRLSPGATSPATTPASQ
jgi:hypothetical protein